MARCGCGGACACNLTAGQGTTVTGTGSAADPWIVSALTNCAEVRTCFTGANGTNVDQGTGVISTCLSTDAGNTLAYGADGCLYNTTNCTSVRGCFSSGSGINYDQGTGKFNVCLSADAGNTLSLGTDGCLYNTTNCAQVRTCFSQTNGISYNPATGVIGTCLSTDPGNNITYGSDGCLFVPTGAATVSTGCGLTGNGAAATPVRVNTNNWPYPCAIGTSGGIVACDPDTGRLYSEPRGQANYTSFQFTRNYANLAVPAGTTGVVLDSFPVTFVNPDPCKSARVVITREVEVWWNLPGTSTTGPSSAAYGITNDETVRLWNTGATTMTNVHVQTDKTFNFGTLAPGASGNYTLDVTGNSGLGGATYSQIEVSIRVLVISI